MFDDAALAFNANSLSGSTFTSIDPVVGDAAKPPLFGQASQLFDDVKQLAFRPDGEPPLSFRSAGNTEDALATAFAYDNAALNPIGDQDFSTEIAPAPPSDATGDVAFASILLSGPLLVKLASTLIAGVGISATWANMPQDQKHLISDVVSSIATKLNPERAFDAIVQAASAGHDATLALIAQHAGAEASRQIAALAPPRDGAVNAFDANLSAEATPPDQIADRNIMPIWQQLQQWLLKSSLPMSETGDPPPPNNRPTVAVAQLILNGAGSGLMDWAFADEDVSWDEKLRGAAISGAAGAFSAYLPPFPTYTGAALSNGIAAGLEEWLRNPDEPEKAGRSAVFGSVIGGINHGVSPTIIDWFDDHRPGGPRRTNTPTAELSEAAAEQLDDASQRIPNELRRFNPDEETLADYLTKISPTRPEHIPQLDRMAEEFTGRLYLEGMETKAQHLRYMDEHNGDIDIELITEILHKADANAQAIEALKIRFDLAGRPKLGENYDFFTESQRQQLQSMRDIQEFVINNGHRNFLNYFTQLENPQTGISWKNWRVSREGISKTNSITRC